LGDVWGKKGEEIGRPVSPSVGWRGKKMKLLDKLGKQNTSTKKEIDKWGKRKAGRESHRDKGDTRVI